MPENAGRRKGTGKRGHIVADTLLPTQMFPRLPARATFVADTNFVCRTQKNVSDFGQKHFVSVINVSQFAHHGDTTFIRVCAPKKHHEQQCVRNNVSSFASTLKPSMHYLPFTVFYIIKHRVYLFSSIRQMKIFETMFFTLFDIKKAFL